MLARKRDIGMEFDEMKANWLADLADMASAIVACYGYF